MLGWSQKGFALLETVLILVFVAIIGGTGYYVWHTKSASNKHLYPQTILNQTNSNKSVSLSSPASPGYKIYKDDKSGISFEYPEGWGNSSATVGGTFYSFEVDGEIGTDGIGASVDFIIYGVGDLYKNYPQALDSASDDIPLSIGQEKLKVNKKCYEHCVINAYAKTREVTVVISPENKEWNSVEHILNTTKGLSRFHPY